MALGERQRRFVQDHNSAAVLTVSADGYAKVARVGIAIVDGKLWSSSTKDRVRTRRLRRDRALRLRHCGPLWLAIEATVTILEGPDVAAQSLRMFRQMQGTPTGPLPWLGGVLEEDAFLPTVVGEGRLTYEFAPERVYGIDEPMG